MRNLPPLHALRVFEVAAQTDSYADAAAELGVTHGAVSRQMAVLETWLGQKLFVKDGRRMVATPAARLFAAEIGLSFDRLVVAAEACGQPGARRIVRVSAPTSFAMRWLIPRLGRFHAGHPDTEVVVTTVSTLFEELRGGVDVTIRRGPGRDRLLPQHRVVPVLDDVDTLIMSPTLFARQPVLKPSDIQGHTLFATETRPGDWRDWLEAAGVHHLAGLPRQRFDHFFVTRQAIEDGLGIGIGPLPMLEMDVANGRLMTPLADIRVVRTGYVAIVGRESDEGGSVNRFVEWLVGERPTTILAQVQPSSL
ncbi:LysR substrate-binding domain-containing protein [Luteibacter sp. 22Crub2.1]|uniref:LysR substrate-binding domain-containing protein n=1 Tax=Luteibacter sp. 22Crub2.1 TaxID=1283288 RepID=UPI0009A62797|nr:LysR substrate-binding domain-containing protein [Luteibacter sp. 22Crub2.1]SKB71328.1 DNA-binding transcriptional regulator, LysR family [Luteibacter sp. 22Crub2.1]